MSYTKLDREMIKTLTNIVGENNSRLDSESLDKYGRDYTEDLVFNPELVLLAKTTEEVSQIAAYCNENCIPLTTRGSGTGLSGACLPVLGGVVLSLERMNQILEIDTKNHQATVEAGVINENLQNAVQEKGLFYPPDPASKGSCTLGGNVAHSSGGPRCVKYGTTKDYILNLKMVLANGEIIHTGANVLKNSTGYHLTQLIIGSEGTLGIVTEITVKLIPYPKYRTLMLASFKDANDACACVPSIFDAGVQASAIEFMDRKGVEWSVKSHSIPFDFADEKAFLLLELDAFNEHELMPQSELVFEALEKHSVLNVLLADNSETIEKFWKIRRSIGEVVKQHSIYKEEDTVVTRAYLPNLYEGVMKISEEYGFETVCYGHAGDGNLHINILKNDLPDELWNSKLPIAIREIFKMCKSYGGTISGEHGIGLVQKPYMDIMFSETQLNLMRGIKKTFDPNLILNPSKIFDFKN
ncbi:MAG: FAD-linked oxidase C-terminal domain-containing protein [Bacteroidia bacterium]